MTGRQRLMGSVYPITGYDPVPTEEEMRAAAAEQEEADRAEAEALAPDDLSALLAAASPRPWRVNTDWLDYGSDQPLVDANGRELFSWPDDARSMANALLIVRLVNAAGDADALQDMADDLRDRAFLARNGGAA